MDYNSNNTLISFNKGHIYTKKHVGGLLEKL